MPVRAKQRSRPMTRKNSIVAVLTLVAVLLTVGGAAAQEATELAASRIGQQTLRPYWHVFIAYAVTIALILGWVVSIGRRLARIEAQLSE